MRGIQVFFLQSFEFRRLEFVEPRIKIHLLDETYAYIPKNKEFHQRFKGGDLGKSKVLGL